MELLFIGGSSRRCRDLRLQGGSLLFTAFSMLEQLRTYPRVRLGA